MDIAISYAFMQLKPMSSEEIEFVSLVTLKEYVESVRKKMMEVCKFGMLRAEHMNHQKNKKCKLQQITKNKSFLNFFPKI